MKTLLVSILILIAMTTFAQEKMVSIPESQLTEQQKAATTFESASKWVGLGEEVGKAVNSGMMALTHNADTFSRTNVGKFTMFMIAYKVIGTDLIQLAIGVPLLFVIITFSALFYFQNVRTRKIFVKANYNAAGKIESKEWKVVEFDSDSAWAWAICTAIAICINMVVIFA